MSLRTAEATATRNPISMVRKRMQRKVARKTRKSILLGAPQVQNAGDADLGGRNRRKGGERRGERRGEERESQGRKGGSRRVWCKAGRGEKGLAGRGGAGPQDAKKVRELARCPRPPHPVCAQRTETLRCPRASPSSPSQRTETLRCQSGEARAAYQLQDGINNHGGERGLQSHKSQVTGRSSQPKIEHCTYIVQ